ncbi:MAG: SEC-C metal-binding domain-containing protein, partial [Alphaproteobacteria bacterium]|nr:SEC-C metal-binding domain-containing protein [Alphaproteobacteria bacterium]
MGKIGRNEKCHCGSDKKYKQCCLENDNFKKYYKRNAEEFIFGGFGVQNERLKPVDSNNGSSFNFYDSKIIIKQDLNIPNLEDLLK